MFSVMFDPLVLEEESLIASFTSVKLALEHEFSNLDSLTAKRFRGGPCIDINERLFSVVFDGGVPLVLDSIVPWLKVVVSQVRRALILQAERRMEPWVFLRIDHLRVKIITGVMDGREDNRSSVGCRIRLEHLRLQGCPLALLRIVREPFHPIAQWLVEEVPRLLAILVFARKVGHRK